MEGGQVPEIEKETGQHEGSHRDKDALRGQTGIVDITMLP